MEKNRIIKKNYCEGEIWPVDEPTIFSGFIESKALQKYQNELFSFVRQKKTRIVDRKVGAAYERFEAARMCSEDELPKSVRELSDLLQERIGSGGNKIAGDHCFCAASFYFPPLGGMTSHRDYSFNVGILGTLVITGKVIFGVGKEREEAYENTRLLYPGELMVLNAPHVSKEYDLRHYFSVFCPEESVVVRSWIRPKEKCIFEGV